MIALVLPGLRLARAAADSPVHAPSSNDADSVTIASAKGGVPIVVDGKDYPLVRLAADLFASDVQRVSGQRPAVTNAIPSASQLVLAGTLGHSGVIDQLAAAGKLKDLDRIRNRWEATLVQVVENPHSGVERALVIVGSDRRGTAYGLMQLSERIGVSPWYWWADVPASHRDEVAVKFPTPQVDAPAVKYRGIFINDEDWGLFQWARQTFDPEFGNIGPKTYEKVFELMLRLRLNYIWPAMHECTREFNLVPENARLAGRYGIVAGASHCEPMLFNNAKWNVKERGKWDYRVNRDTIHGVWEDEAKTRGGEEAVWTLGIRGIHDRGMEGPGETSARILIVSNVIAEQRALLNRYVTKEWGPVAQAFVPYKEVLSIYDAGLKVPDDVTLVWVDDNFGFIRRLSNLEERKRGGGSGVYWHLSYYGSPHSYLWINSTPPALMWEELHKAWENDARTIWMLNVGDIKPLEIGIDYYARFSWDVEGFGPDSQPRFLREFAAKNFGAGLSEPIAQLLTRFYALGAIRKPELMTRHWAISLPRTRAVQLRDDYESLLRREASTAAAIPAQARDAYDEMIGFPARVLAVSGLIFLADREIQLGGDATVNEAEIAKRRAYLDRETAHYNDSIAGGKWKHMMPGAVTAKDLPRWNSQVRWPWGEPPRTNAIVGLAPSVSDRAWRDAASADRQSAADVARWTLVSGLGASGRAMALKPATARLSWAPRDSHAPGLEFDFTAKGGDFEALIDFLPTFRLYPGMALRVAVSVDDQPQTLVEVPGASGREDERGAVRTDAVQDNYARARMPLPGLSAGKHTFKIRAVDPGVVIDRISLEQAGDLPSTL